MKVGVLVFIERVFLVSFDVGGYGLVFFFFRVGWGGVVRGFFLAFFVFWN